MNYIDSLKELPGKYPGISFEPVREKLWLVFQGFQIYSPSTHLIGQINLGDFPKLPVYAMFSRSSYFHIHLSWLSVGTENIMWSPAKKFSILWSSSTRFFLDGNLSHLSALWFLVKNVPFYTCTLENSCFNFLYVTHEKKTNNIQFICSLSEVLKGWDKMTTIVPTN